MVNNTKLHFALRNSKNQSDNCSIISISNSSTKSQISALKGKSAPKTTSKFCPRVFFTTDTISNTPRQSPSSSNLNAPLTDSPHVLSFDKVVGKVFNKNIITSLTSKDAVLKELIDCIIRADEERLKKQKPQLHNYWLDLHFSSGSVCMGKKIAIPNARKKSLKEDLHASYPVS